MVGVCWLTTLGGFRRALKRGAAPFFAALLILTLIPAVPSANAQNQIEADSVELVEEAEIEGVDIGLPTTGGVATEVLYSTEGNRMRRIDTSTIDAAVADGADLGEAVVVRSASDPALVNETGTAYDIGRDVNGEICFFEDGTGRFVAGEDTGQPNPPAGWGVFEADGTQAGKLTATYQIESPEPFGCEFAANGNLFTSDVGFQGFGDASGQLILWFDPDSTYPGPAGAYPDTDEPSTNFCKLATDLGTAGSVTIDDRGRVYVSQASGLSIERFSPPFPTSADAAGGCGDTDNTGAPLADSVNRETFAVPSDGMATFSGLALAPNGNIFAASVLTGHIAEYDLEGNLVRLILDPEREDLPIATGNPQSLAVGSDGTLYYSDLDLQGVLPDVGTGGNGKLWRIRFDRSGDPLAPEMIRDSLRFPDGLGIRTEPFTLPIEWSTQAGGPLRQSFNPAERWLTPETAPNLVEKWTHPTEAVVTSSPVIATVDLPGEGPTRVVYVSSWDGMFHAVRFDDGSVVWQVEWEDQPGATFVGAGGPTIADVDGRRMLIVPGGQYLYGLDAATGEEQWRFATGTGCRDPQTGEFPGLCAFDGERNEIETTPIVHNNIAYFGMDVNDVATGKGGFFGVDVTDGTLAWYFDVATGATCTPNPGDEIRRYDGYHSEAELGLPAGFFASRAGCDHDRGVTGCGNVWTTAALDVDREMIFFGTSNCDTDNDPATPEPGPNMPPFDEALVALNIDGTAAWRWRPREVDPDDLAFGAGLNLFSIRDPQGLAEPGAEPAMIDVVGIGNKDGTYYVVDRDGVNEVTGLAWDDPAPRDLPYWETNVVPGGRAGGIIATAAVDEVERRVHFGTAPGFDPLDPQQPTVHTLDLDTGEIIWQNTDATGSGADASFGHTSAVPGVVMVGATASPHLRIYDAADGTLLFDEIVGNNTTLSGISSGAAVLDGTVIVGTGLGARTNGGSTPGDFTANSPATLSAWCVPGTRNCPGPEPTVLAGGVTIEEGDEGRTRARIPVTLSAPSQEVVSVRWSTLDLWAEAPEDFVAAQGVLSFPAGRTEATIDIQVIGDLEAEDDELAVVGLSDATNAEIGGFFGLGAIRITDDD